MTVQRAVEFGLTGESEALTTYGSSGRRSPLQSFLEQIGAADIREGHSFSLDHPEEFWREVHRFFGITFDEDFTEFRTEVPGSIAPRWFTGGRMNAAKVLLSSAIAGGGSKQCQFVTIEEGGSSTEADESDILDWTASFVELMTSSGITKGDRVALLLPMSLESVVAFVACASMGVVVLPIFSGYGPEGIADRINDAAAVALVLVQGFTRRGKVVDLAGTAQRALAHCPSIRTVLHFRRDSLGIPTPAFDVPVVDCSLGPPGGGRSGRAELEFASLDPNHPMLILYTSGTTGKPKGVVLTHGGFLSKVAVEFGIVFGFTAEDTLFWLGDMGWMVGPLTVMASMLLKMRTVLYSGAINFPEEGRIWDLVADQRVTILGFSPSAVRQIRADAPRGHEQRDLETLRTFISTGEAWDRESWEWLIRNVGGSRLPILNYTGGTETGGGILACYEGHPLRPLAFTGPILGMPADVTDHDGKPVRGEVGELVLHDVWPGMTQGLWRDESDERFAATYWSDIPGKWRHGDLAMIDDDGYWYVLGRSDDTIKIAGKRVGPSEVETALLQHPDVAQAAAVGIEDPAKGQSLLCFVSLRREVDAGDTHQALSESLAQLVVNRLGKSLRPSAVHIVSGIPVTKTGKTMRRVLRSAWIGEAVGDTSSLENPEVVDEIAALRAELQNS